MQAEARDRDPESCRSAPDCATAAPDDSGVPSPGSRALVPIHPIDSGIPVRRCGRYPSATFLAHLIAVDRRLPQTRRRGRAGPADAAAVYSATSTDVPARPGRKLRRSA